MTNLPLTDPFAPGSGLEALEREVLPSWMPRCRWFGGKARSPQRFRIVIAAPISDLPQAARLLLVQVEYADLSKETYFVPLQVSGDKAAAEIARDYPQAIAATLDEAGQTILHDALCAVEFRSSLLALMAAGSTLENAGGTVVGLAGDALPGLLGEEVDPPSRLLRVEQSNSSVIYGERLFVKIFRKLEEGLNPDAEILRYLTERRHFPHAPAYGGGIEFRGRNEEPRLLALGLSVVPNSGDAWAFALSEVAQCYRRVLEHDADASGLCLPGLFGSHDWPELVERAIGPEFLARAVQLGVRTGELHLALAAENSDPDFVPEPFTVDDQRRLASGLEASVGAMIALCESQRASLAPEVVSEVDRLLQATETLQKHVTEFASAPSPGGAKTRTHGDYHLGQVLETGSDFVIIDFEGEPSRSLRERREKRSPLRDVAGMLRSFHYAAHSALGDFPEHQSHLEHWAEVWAIAAMRAFLDGWVRTTSGAAFLPNEAAAVASLLDAFLLEKAFYEVAYELNNRPTWVGIPARGILRLVAAD